MSIYHGTHPSDLNPPPKTIPPYLAPPFTKVLPTPGNDQSYQGNTPRPRKLNQDEFIYPPGTIPKYVCTNSLNKYGKTWELKITSKEDLSTFYNTLQNLLTEYNIYLRPYESITRNNGLELITPNDCSNFIAAKSSMSKALFTFLDQNKSTIFEHYTEPIHLIDAYRPDFDGFEFLKQIMEEWHPNLKPLVDNNTRLNSIPKFANYPTIYTFINAYINWITDERIQNCTYTDKDKLDWILSQLDSRWTVAITKVEKMKQDIYIDETSPKPFPNCLKLTSKLGIWLTKQIPEDLRSSLHNDIDTDTQALVNKTYFKSKGRPNDKPPSYHKKTHSSKKQPDINWSKVLKYETIPNARCPGCGGINHNVYSTGCPTLARFAICKEFYDSQPKEAIEPVIKSYNEYMKTLRTKMKTRRNEGRKFIKRCASKTDRYDNEDIDTLRTEWFETYKEDFEDYDNITDDNPFDTYDLEPDDSDQDSQNTLG